MDSPVRKALKRNDYLRHKLFRKIKRRQRNKTKLDLKIAEKELKRRLRNPKFDSGTDDNKVKVTERTYPDGSVVYFADDGKTLTPINTMDSDYMSNWTWLNTDNPRVTYTGVGNTKDPGEIRLGEGPKSGLGKLHKKLYQVSNRRLQDPVFGAYARFADSWDNDTNPLGVAYNLKYDGGKKAGIPVDYLDPSEVMPLVANNPNKSIVLDEVVVTPYKKLPMQSDFFEGETNQAANERADEHTRRVAPTVEDLFAIGTLGGLSNLSPAQWARRAYDLGEAINGNMSWDNFGNSWFYGNNGLVSDKYAQEHPYASAAINLVGDVGAFSTFSALRKLPKYAALMLAENKAAQEATAINWRDMLANSTRRTRLGDVEIDNPGLYYHQSDAGKAKNFVSTNRMRTPLEEYWLAKEEAGEKIPLTIQSGAEPGYPQDPGSAMFAQGNLWYGLTPNKPDLLVTAKEMPIANKNASIMSNKASLKALYEQGSRRVTNDNIYTQGPHNAQNTSAYTWEPGYGYRRVVAEETPTVEWSAGRTAPDITAENATKYDLFRVDKTLEDKLTKRALNAYLSGDRSFETLLGAKKFANVGGIYSKYPSTTLAELVNTVIPRIKANRPWMGDRDIENLVLNNQKWGLYPSELFDKAGHSSAAGLHYGGNDGIAIRAGYSGSDRHVLPHEVRHRIDDALPATEYEEKVLGDAYDNDFIETNSWIDGPYDPSPERVTTNSDARAIVLGPVHLRLTPPQLQNKIIDSVSDEEIFNAVENANGYGQSFIKRLRRRGKLTHEKANLLRLAMKVVPAALPFAVAAYGTEEQYSSGKDIHIKPSKRCTFTAAAKKHGMSVQAYARKVLKAPKGKYSSAMRKKANFARNAAKFKH